MDYEIVFESDRIYFVKVSQKLVNEYLNMINDIEVQKYISNERRTYDLDGEIKWIDKKLAQNDYIYSMIEKETNEFIGNIEIMEINNNIGELGISITRSKQDNHFGQEAIKRLIEYAFNDLELDGLELNVYNFNPRGIKCYENAGFVKAGQGKDKDDIHMVIKKNTN